MRTFFGWILAAMAFIAFLAISGAFYVVSETQQAIVTQFGQPVGGPVNEAGVHFKVPFMQKVTFFDKRVLQWDGPASEMLTKDKLGIMVDTFARWRITDPLQFFLRLRDVRSAQSRLDDIIGSETRNTVARYHLVELIRTSKDRKPLQDELIPGGSAQLTVFSPIQHGRVLLEKEVSDQSRVKLEEFGIALLDVRFMRINYNPAVSSKIYERMISERKQIAERYRSEGAGEAAKILGTRERDIKQIDSEAYRQAQTVQGKADAEAISIYAEAFNQNPEAREFYEFQRSLETYRTALTQGTTVVLSTKEGFLRFFKGVPPTKPTTAPAPPNYKPALAPPAPPKPAPLEAPKPPAPPAPAPPVPVP